MKSFATFLVLLCCGWSAWALNPPHVDFEFIMDTPPWPYCHVCSLSERSDGAVIASFQGGSGEGKNDSKIWSSVRDPKTGQWSRVQIAAERNGWCVMNACQYMNEEGTIFLTFHSGDLFHPGECSTHTWSGYYTYSTDGGNTWNKDNVALPEKCLGCIKNKCIKLSNGEVLCPSSTEAVDLIGYWEAHMETTDSNFTEFVRRSNIKFNYAPETEKVCQGVIQPTLFETSPGHVLALLRSGCEVVAMAQSDDYGHTWPEWASGKSGLPNPNAGIDGVMMNGQSDIGLLLSYNDNAHHRTPLSLAHSVDGGSSWEKIVDLENDPNGSYAYPAIIQSKQDPRVAHVCYTYNDGGKHNMRYARVSFDE